MIAFVILHYLTESDTRTCIDSIRTLSDYPGNHIIVVDNASNNGSLESLLSYYNNDSDIIFIKNKENLGFAKGNNIGYEYARKKLHANIIITINNDCFIKQHDFIKRLISIVAQGFDLIGPDIINIRNQHHQSPTKPPLDYRKDLKHYSRLLTIYTVLPPFLAKIFYTKVENPRIHAVKEKQYKVPKTVTEHVQLHGACLIFANHFVTNEEKAFNPKTFLYLEEDLLFQYCSRLGYRIAFDPNLTVLHNASSSTIANSTSFSKKRKNNLRNLRHSAKLVVQEIGSQGQQYRPDDF